MSPSMRLVLMIDCAACQMAAIDTEENQKSTHAREEKDHAPAEEQQRVQQTRWRCRSAIARKEVHDENRKRFGALYERLCRKRDIFKR